MAEVGAEIDPSVESEISLAKKQLQVLIDSHALDALDGLIMNFQSQGKSDYARELELICQHPDVVGPLLKEQLHANGIEIGINIFSPKDQMIQDKEQTLSARLMFGRSSVPHGNKYRLKSVEKMKGETSLNRKLKVTNSYTVELEPIESQLSKEDEEERGEQFRSVTIKAVSAPGEEIDLIFMPEIATSYKQGNTNNVPTIGLPVPGGTAMRLNRLAWKKPEKVQDAVITTYNHAKIRSTG